MDGIPNSDDSEIDTVYAQYVKVEFDHDDTWVFIDEIEVLGTDEKIEGALDLVEDNTTTVPNVELGEISDLSNYEHLSDGLEYTISHPASASYPGHREFPLTNREKGTKDFSDPAWQGHNKNESNTENRDIIIDLGESKSIGYIDANFFSDSLTGINYPELVQIQVSETGKDGSWATLADLHSTKGR